MILVTGATGNVGSQVVEQLSSTGETLDAALEGVDQLFLLMGPPRTRWNSRTTS
jgi:uncharacterized protein YbjT (DUF2867 family)